MKTDVLKITQIQKTFMSGQQHSQVLKGVSFTVKEGEYVAISGPSGCGKSTLLNILGLLDTPDSGEYYIDGLLVSDMDADQRAAIRSRRIGFVFQSFNLIDEYTVLDNVALPLKYRGDSLKQRQARARECLDKVGLADKTQLFPNQLSGGQQQRVSIARALAADSGIMLVDEPTGNLDSKNGDAVMALLAELNAQGTTICLVTHDARYAQMAKRQIHLLDGQVVVENIAVEQVA
ncbi:ABC transporter ATP-binding protein [Shewanella sp. CG12_big_fil_rev_8_21_14_0_65_47_15]|uniref:ABC transporter ATP-binding protein n=1 Tax=Shewanella sp. CG12_big_fil_rev_8_21_14_0_65_47_15 TaxID=1975537 RepID=UPI000CA757E2|nr:ABC transporter ATP-binding protein [Shewanella sp. CG12_big_fil_rev_8_21_14_0_65_47_15]PIW60067.1 MAG: ABC transporter ATP-binding protein [Shewanella sp. CG12_big_fil_rev_8_21_14_0_65_47_15]